MPQFNGHAPLDAARKVPIDNLDLDAIATGLAADFQPLDADLTAIAALTTTAYGRALLALADAAAGRIALGLGTAATTASTDYAPAVTTVWIGADSMFLGNGAARAVVSGAEVRPSWWLFDQTTEERVTLEVDLPAAWTTYDVYLHWAPNVASTADAVWRYSHRAITPGTTLTAAGGTSMGNITATAAGTNVVVRTLIASGAARAAAPCAGNLRRVAGDAADTIAGDCGVIWLEFVKAT